MLLHYHSLEHVDFHSLMDESEHIEFHDDMDETSLTLSVSADLERLLTQDKDEEVMAEEWEELPTYKPFAAMLAPGPAVREQSTIDTIGSMPMPASIDIGDVRYTEKRRRSTSTSSHSSLCMTQSTP